MYIIPYLQSATLSKLSILKLFRLALMAVAFTICFTSCKKDNVPEIETEVKPDPEPVILPDSIYFEVNGTSYTSKDVWSVGMGNSGVRLKLLDGPVENMKDWGTIDGKIYSSPVDSIYFHYKKSFGGSAGNATLSFGKGFHVRDMVKAGSMWYPKDIRKMLDKGKQDFAVDFQNINAIDGVCFSFDPFGESGMGEFNFKDVSDFPQDDSHFEIMKKEQVDSDRYRIEAEFELNLYDAEGKKTRLTNGFVRFSVYKRWWGMVDLF